MARCPFYGCRWPDRSPELSKVGGNECGLDVERHAACKMEVEQRDVNLFACPVADAQFALLSVFESVVRVPVAGEKITFLEWKRRFLTEDYGRPK